MSKVRLSDFLGVLREFFELHPDGVTIPADMAGYFRAGAADAETVAKRLEGIVFGALEDVASDDEGCTFGRAAREQQAMAEVRASCIRIDDKVVALPNEFRRLAMARIEARR
jgi:hypothetical protein